MFKERLVFEYGGIDFLKQAELNIVEFSAIARDAFIHSLNRSEEGRDYLERCWVAEQTKPDREALRRHFHIEEG